MRWILTYDENGISTTKKFGTLNAMFDFIIERDLPRFKAKRV